MSALPEKNTEYDLILDIKMPKMDRIEVLERSWNSTEIM